MKRSVTYGGRILAVLLTLAMTVGMCTVLAADSNDWSAPYMENAQEKGWIIPADGAVAGEPITRAEFAVMLWRALGSIQPDIDNPFSDVPANALYAGAVTTLYNWSILDGVGQNLFSPDTTLTREMAVTILARAYDLSSDGTAADSFTDAADIHSWAKQAVAALFEKGYTDGVGDGQFGPGNALTWGEAAKYLSDLYNGEAGRLRFDYTEEIANADFKNTGYTVPKAVDVPLQVSSASGATGVVLVASIREGNTSDLYLNTYVAGDALTIFGKGIASAVKVCGNDETALTVADDSLTFTPAAIAVEDPVDEIVKVTLADGTVYSIHTVHEKLPLFEITANENPTDGVYTAAIDKFMVRLSNDGTVVYYRYMGHHGGNLVANFQPHDLDEGRYYTYFYETNSGLRDPSNGYNSGMFVIMDENYVETDYLTLLPTEKHGEGYLDQHEIMLISPTHYLLLSYTRERVTNIPVAVSEGSKAYVQASIVQEVKDGAVLLEIDSTDYPELYALTSESMDYANSSLEVPASICDYVHPNSINVDERDGNIIVSMRNMSSVIKFDRETGEILWILGGPGNQFTGFEDYLNSKGWIFLNQHDAKYVDESVAGNNSTISVFDNEFNFAANTTRTLMLKLDEDAKTATVTNVINGIDYDEQTNVYHWGTHCGNVNYQTPNSAVIGWGLHVRVDTVAENALAGAKALVSEIDPATGELLFEIVPSRNPNNAEEKTSFMSYRTYKSVG